MWVRSWRRCCCVRRRRSARLPPPCKHAFLAQMWARLARSRGAALGVSGVGPFRSCTRADGRADAARRHVAISNSRRATTATAGMFGAARGKSRCRCGQGRGKSWRRCAGGIARPGAELARLGDRTPGAEAGGAGRTCCGSLAHRRPQGLLARVKTEFSGVLWGTEGHAKALRGAPSCRCRLDAATADRVQCVCANDLPRRPRPRRRWAARRRPARGEVSWSTL